MFWWMLIIIVVQTLVSLLGRLLSLCWTLLSPATNYSLTRPLDGPVWVRHVPVAAPACPSVQLLVQGSLHLAAIISLGINVSLTRCDTRMSGCHNTHEDLHCCETLWGRAAAQNANNNNYPSEDVGSPLVQPRSQWTWSPWALLKFSDGGQRLSCVHSQPHDSSSSSSWCHIFLFSL